jgi:hypothetical protein
MTRSVSPGVLVLGILTLVFSVLGIAYTIVGLAGGPDAFTILGPVCLGTALVCGAILVPLRARARAAQEAMTARGRATVAGVELHPYVRVGSLVNVTLTVRLAGREVSRRVNVSPLLRLEPGAEIEVAYDPADPARFEPLLATAGSPAAQSAPGG